MKKIEEIINLSSPTIQKIVAIEELSELQKELTKDLRGNESNVLEELADVLIMIKQLVLIYDVDTDDLEDIMNAKIERTIKRLKGEQTND